MADRKTTDNYFVNTKTTCFLCLGTASSPFILSDGTRKKGPTTITIDKKHIGQFSLRSIFRYLEMETGEIFSSCGSNRSILKRVEKQLAAKNISVILGQDCGETASQLSVLCEQLEQLQLKVDNTVQIFLEKLNSTGEAINGEELASNFGLDVVDAMLTDILREKTEEKCRLRLGACSPNESLPLRGLTPEVKLEVPEEPPLILELDEDEGDHITQPDFEISHVSFKLPTMNEIPHQIANNNLVTCLICPESANSVFGRDSLFMRHVACCHLDFLFGVLKLPDLTSEQFKEYCEYLLEHEMKASEQVDSTLKKNTDQVPGFVCSMCEDIFHEPKVALVHLVLTHHEILASKLVCLLKNPTINPDVLRQQPKTYPTIFALEGPKYKCEDCGRVFAASSSLVRHKKSPCQKPDSQNLSTSKKLGQIGDTKCICEYCGVRCSTTTGKKYHIQRIHMGKNHNRYRTSCDLCGKTMSLSSLGRHKKLSCPIRNGSSSSSAQLASFNVMNTQQQILFGDGSVDQYHDEDEEDPLYSNHVKSEAMEMESEEES